VKKYFVLILILISCNGSESESNSILKSKIDSLSLKGTQTKYEVDSLGRIIDTVSVVKWKENSQGKTVYENSFYIFNGDTMVTKSYYHDNGELISQISTSSISNRITEICFQLDMNGDIIDGFMITESDLEESADTFYFISEIDYYLNGNKKRQKVSSKFEDEEIFYVSNFNRKGKVIYEAEFNDSDTLSYTNYFYTRRGLQKKEIIKFLFEKKRKEVLEYNKERKVELIINYQANEFGFWEKIDSTFYEYRDDGYKLSEVEVNFVNKSNRYFKFEVEL